MELNILLSKCITLLYRESQIENSTENSADLIKTVVEKIRINDINIGLPAAKNTAQGLKTLILEMCNHSIGHTYELSDFLQHLRIITNGDENLYLAISQGIEQELQPAVLKRTITNIRKTISLEFRDQKQNEIIARAYKDLNFNKLKISDQGTYISNLITELEVASNRSVGKDSAIVRSMKFSDEDSMREAYSNVAESSSGDLAFTTGWRELNEALQGGPRPGDCMVIGALQHNYKTGSSLSLFTHIPIYNKPKNKDPSKKPLAYRITLEDPLRNNAQFIYLLLKFEETGEIVDVKGLSIDDMWQYVKKRMCVNGYDVLIDEVNPLNWTYMSIINRIIELESEGYVIEVLSIDYLAKIPTTGCSQGSIGDDMLDMLARVRAYCLA